MKRTVALVVTLLIAVGAVPLLTKNKNFAWSRSFATFTPATEKKSVAEPTPTPRRPDDPQALIAFRNRLMSEQREGNQHGVYIEALNTHEPIAAWNERELFNPASVVKLATTLVALEKLGADYRFRTEFRATGEIDARTGALNGDLIMLSGSDPSFSIPDAQNVGDALRRSGVRRVNGSLVVVGPFTCNHNSQTDISAGVFRRQSRLALRDNTRFETDKSPYNAAKLLLAVESDTLLHILQQQNAHSVNSMADFLGDYIGGVRAVRDFLVEKAGLPDHEVFVMRASGLEINRLTPQGTARILRMLTEWLRARGYKLEDVMPVAGVDYSTLAGRFTEPEFAGSVIAKTGTLTETDDGAAALSGVAMTRKYGPVLFVIYDMAEGRSVRHLRQMQDEFLKNLMTELGGPAALASRLEPAPSESLQSRLILADKNPS
ncbi:MAG TPA: D-alanyl-D-alanine carboxypeptidase [Blastocatellia bacterium]|nr:D-alanyl-D-alanine carboxypeptidase [Blastocatellia bacterium]